MRLRELLDNLFRRDESLYEMANLRPQRTGLPFVIFISQKWNARHAVRIKVGRSTRVNPNELISVGIRPYIHVIRGKISAKDFELLSQFIILNYDTIIAYWNGDIEYTEDMLAEIRPITD